MIIDYANLPLHDFSEKIVDILCEKVGKTQRDFFRIHVAYNLCVLAASMRTSISLPGSGTEPVNFYGINLAPSGFGKGHSTAIIENTIIKGFVNRFMNETFPLMAETNLPKIAADRAARSGADFDEEMLQVEKEFKGAGTLFFNFDSATIPAVKQLRSKLIMAEGGAINLQTDEIGANLTNSKELMILFLELFSGTAKNKLIKNTGEFTRTQDMQGVTPTNMMLFGVGSALLDSGPVEELMRDMYDQGYGRRCFFGYVDEIEDGDSTHVLKTPEELLEQIKNSTSDSDAENIAKYLANLANYHPPKVLPFPDETAKLFFQYGIDCAEKAKRLKRHKTLEISEQMQRPFKTAKLAGMHAFIDQTNEVQPDHFLAAINLAERSGKAYSRMLNRDKAYVLLAKYLGDSGEAFTHTDLMEQLPYFKGSKAQREDLIVQAISWGYVNNVLIRRSDSDGVEFIQGESLMSTNLNEMTVSYSRDVANYYKNDTAKWEDLHIMATMPGLQWINHHLEGGDDEDPSGHRNDNNCIEGFNLVVIDVDGGVPLSLAKQLLSKYKALYYTTKSHTPENNRFRILLPTNYRLEMDKEDYRDLMKNIFQWLPFDSDDATGQRARKWMSYGGPGSHYEYTEGEVLDILPFIPKTAMQAEYQRKAKELNLESLNNLERWVLEAAGDGNRNNLLMKYAYVLLDAGHNKQQIEDKVLALNAKFPSQLNEVEIFGTIMKTVNSEISARSMNGSKQ